MKLLLQHKTVAGYLLLMVIIGCMVAIVLHERNRVQDIEDESLVLYQTQRNINAAHRYVTILATYGESTIAWDEEDCIAYHERRLRTDSLLLILREQCKDFILPAQMDTLRTLLEDKEKYLFRIMKTFQQQEETDSLRSHNKELNRKLCTLIIRLDEQTVAAFEVKEERLISSYENSSLIIIGLITFSIVLLFVSYLVINWKYGCNS